MKRENTDYTTGNTTRTYNKQISKVDCNAIKIGENKNTSDYETFTCYHPYNNHIHVQMMLCLSRILCVFKSQTISSKSIESIKSSLVHIHRGMNNWVFLD
jgi:hypothetical protein